MQQAQNQQQPAISRPPAGISGPLPGRWWATAAVSLSAVACWFWLIPGLQTLESRPIDTFAANELAPIADRDLTAALSTMEGTPKFLSQFKSETSGCPTPMAWIAIMRGPGQTPTKIRVQSGSYFSPAFDLPATPMRIAIPYPAPYESGHGQLTVMTYGGGATLALAPAWQVPPNAGPTTRGVVWQPS